MTGTIVCFGELLIRMGPSGHQRLESASQLDLHVGGAEANVASALSQFGHMTRMVSAVPENAFGAKTIAELKSRDINCDQVKHGPGRLGFYFLETGAVQRPSSILYDRAHSTFSQVEPDQYDWDAIFDGAAVLHLSGITPAVSAKCAEAAWDGVAEAARRGIQVSFDGNYRRALWEEWSGDGPQILRRLIEHSSIAFINEKDLGLIFQTEFETRQQAIDFAFDTFPNLKTIAATRRAQSSVAVQTLRGELYQRNRIWTSRLHQMDGVIDRIGGGDAFAAGVLSALISGDDPQTIVDFATAASVFKHSIPGDCLVGTKAEILRLMEQDNLDVKR